MFQDILLLTMKVERLFGFKQLSINIKIKRDSVSISDRWSVTVNKPIFLSGGHRDVFESALKAGVWRHIQFLVGFKR